MQAPNGDLPLASQPSRKRKESSREDNANNEMNHQQHQVTIIQKNEESNSIGLLHEELLTCVLDFVGSKTYRFIAPVCREWKSQYLQLHGPEKSTSLDAVVSSLSTVLLYKREASAHNILADRLLCEMGRNGDLQAMQWLFSRNLWPLSTKLACGAALGGCLDVLKWARANGCEWDEVTCSYAAWGGHFDILKWARANDCPWDLWTCTWAARGGNLEMLQWARANGCPWDTFTCYVAASEGHMAVLKWARANGCDWDEGTCSWAAKGGRLEVLKWLRTNGCPWNLMTCYSAAEGGHLGILKWARENGCPWNGRTCSSAAREGHLDVLKWARANGCPWSPDGCLEAAREGAHIEVGRWIQEHSSA